MQRTRDAVVQHRQVPRGEAKAASLSFGTLAQIVYAVASIETGPRHAVRKDKLIGHVVKSEAVDELKRVVVFRDKLIGLC